MEVRSYNYHNNNLYPFAKSPQFKGYNLPIFVSKMAKDSTTAHNNELLFQIKEHGSEKARVRLVRAYIKKINKIAGEISENTKSLTQKDLFQEGMIGFLNAINKYKPNTSTFSTYANTGVKIHILDAITKKDRMMGGKLDYLGFEKSKNEILDKHFAEYNEILSDEQLAEKMGKKLSTIEGHKAQNITSEADFAARNPHLPYLTLFDTVKAYTDDVPREAVIGDSREFIDDLLFSFPPRVEQIIIRHFGLGIQEPQANYTIGKQMGLDKAYIKTVINKAYKTFEGIKNNNPNQKEAYKGVYQKFATLRALRKNPDLLENMSEKEQYILTKSFGLFDEEEQSTNEIGKALGISGQTVLNTINRIVKNLPAPSKA